MQITVCKSKIHRATITGGDTGYVGSITIDSDLVKQADMVRYERVQICNVTNGERFETYIIPGEAGKGEIILNGAAARRGLPGDIVIIIAYGIIEKDEAEGHQPVVVHVDANNRPVKI